MIKIASIHPVKIHQRFAIYYMTGRTSEVRQCLLDYLTPSQRNWLTKRPWQVKMHNGEVELYARMGKHIPVEEESKAVTILFATI